MNVVYNMDMAHVQAVERALAILMKLGDCPQGMGTAELVNSQYHIQPIDWVGVRAPLHVVADDPSVNYPIRD